VYTSARAGVWTVTASYGAFNTSAGLTVNPGTPASVVVSPASAAITTDDTQTYSVTATDAFGNTWTPTLPASAWTVGAGLSGAFDDANTFTPTGPGQGVVQCQVGGIASNDAQLDVYATSGPGLTLAWDATDQRFYLCANPSDPASAGAAGLIPNVTGTHVVNGVSVTVSGATGNRAVSVNNTSGITNSLRIRWYIRSGAVYRALLYSTIGTTSTSATYDAGKTFIGGADRPGFWCLTHILNAADPTAITCGMTQQP